MRAAAQTLDKLSSVLNRLAMTGAMIGVILLVLIAGWQVVARYLLDQPPVWTEELARYTMVWAGVLGASCAFRLRADPSLFPAMQARGGIWAILRAGATMVFVAPILWFSVFGANMNPARGFIARQSGRQAETMDLSMIVFAIGIPIAFAIITVHVAAQLAKDLSRD